MKGTTPTKVEMIETSVTQPRALQICGLVPDKHHNTRDTASRSATDQATKTDRMIISGESWKKAWQFASAALAVELKNTAATAHLL